MTVKVPRSFSSRASGTRASNRAESFAEKSCKGAGGTSGFARCGGGCPPLSDLVALETPLDKTVKLHRRAACGIVPAPAIATHHLIILSHHILDGDLQIRHEPIH